MLVANNEHPRIFTDKNKKIKYFLEDIKETKSLLYKTKVIRQYVISILSAPENYTVPGEIILDEETFSKTLIPYNGENPENKTVSDIEDIKQKLEKLLA